MYGLIILIGLVFGILQIVLFFKVWQMTNDIKEFKEMYKIVHSDKIKIRRTPIDIPPTKEKQAINTLHIDAVVVRISDNKTMTIRNITNEGKYSYYSGLRKEGEYTKDEIKPLSVSQYFSIGDLVILKATEKQMRIKEITKDDKYACYTNNGQFHEGDFGEEEIRMF